MLEPLADRLIIKPIEEESQTASGLVIPDQAKDRPQRGEVLSIGPDTPQPLAACQTVLYSKYAGTEIEEDGQQLLVLRADDVLAIIREEN